MRRQKNELFLGNEGNYDHERNFIHEYDLNNLVFFYLRGVFTAGGIFLCDLCELQCLIDV